SSWASAPASPGAPPSSATSRSTVRSREPRDRAPVPRPGSPAGRHGEGAGGTLPVCAGGLRGGGRRAGQGPVGRLLRGPRRAADGDGRLPAGAAGDLGGGLA